MELPRQVPRSVYAERLASLGDVVRSARPGAGWRWYFHERIGRAFNGRVVLDLGCYNAAFLCKIAAKHPSVAFIGLDWKFKAIHDGARGVEQFQLQNVTLIRDRAQNLGSFFGEGELDEIWILHPEPCERPNELRNRLVAQQFLCEIHRTLKPDGLLAFKTDHAAYHQSVLDAFHGAIEEEEPARFEIAVESLDFWNDPNAQEGAAGRLFAGEMTFYEQRFVRKRKPICYLELRRKGSLALREDLVH